MLPDADLLVARLVVGAEDRAARFVTPTGTVLVVADGAGGMGGGAAAAEAVLAAVGSAHDMRTAQGWAELLERVDAELRVGETTAVVCSILGDVLVGASVGDSGAWRIEHRGGAIEDLTHAQRRKPLLGSGRAVAVGFTARLGDATLLLASDGLLKYASAAKIAACVDRPDLDAIAGDLLDLVRLRSGALPDDVAVLLARRG